MHLIWKKVIGFCVATNTSKGKKRKWKRKKQYCRLLKIIFFAQEIITRKLKNNRRKRNIRLPKSYDPNVPPDPERWLPKQERAAYKRKLKKNKDRDIGRGTQGSASANPNVYVLTLPFTHASLELPCRDWN